jgi:hypothetical protein
MRDCEPQVVVPAMFLPHVGCKEMHVRISHRNRKRVPMALTIQAAISWCPTEWHVISGLAQLLGSSLLQGTGQPIVNQVDPAAILQVNGEVARLYVPVHEPNAVQEGDGLKQTTNFSSASTTEKLTRSDCSPILSTVPMLNL